MPEDHACANSCGFFGSPATLNHLSSYQTPRAETVRTVLVEPEFGVPNRCGTCRKRVGLTGFKCRCGVTCCGTHRYAELHGCTWDYKGAGKVAIARENPVVKAEKLAKI